MSSPQKLLIYFAIKIKDGLYIGNQRAPQEKDFLSLNKIFNIINCASSQIKIPNHFNCLNYDWQDEQDQIIITQTIVEQIYTFIEEAFAEGQGVIVCSVRGQSRALSVVTAYFMRKYNWSLFKILQFLNSRRKDFEIRQTFLNQLVQFEKQYFQNKMCSKDWDESVEGQESLLIKNTYLNAQKYNQDSQQLLDSTRKQQQNNNNSNNKKLTWNKILITMIDYEQLGLQNKQTTLKPILKSNIPLLKGFRDKKINITSNQDTNNNENGNFDEFLEQNILIKYMNQPLEFKKKTETLNSTIKNRIKIKRSQSPNTTTINSNHKKDNQLIETYLDTSLLSHTPHTKLFKTRNITPIRERFRSVSNQETKHKLHLPQQTSDFVKKWVVTRNKPPSIVKRQVPQFKIK